MIDLIKATIEWAVPTGETTERRQSLTEELTPEEITQILGIMVKASVRHAKGPCIIADQNTDPTITTPPHFERYATILDSPMTNIPKTTCNSEELE